MEKYASILLDVGKTLLVAVLIFLTVALIRLIKNFIWEVVGLSKSCRSKGDKISKILLFVLTFTINFVILAFILVFLAHVALPPKIFNRLFTLVYTYRYTTMIVVLASIIFTFLVVHVLRKK